MASRQTKLEVIEDMFKAFAELDADRFVSHLTDDVRFRPSAFVTGKGEFHGPEEVRQNLLELRATLEETGESVRLRPTKFLIDADDEDLVLVLAKLRITRSSGESFGTETAYLHRMEGDRVAELNTWLDHAEGLRQLSRPEPLAPESGG